MGYHHLPGVRMCAQKVFDQGAVGMNTVPSASSGVSGPDTTLLRRCRPLRLVALSFSAV
jgi:hypothetical protein